MRVFRNPQSNKHMTTAHNSGYHPKARIVDAIYVGHHAADHPQAPNQPVLAWVLKTAPAGKKYPVGAYALVINGMTTGFQLGTTEEEARRQAAEEATKNAARYL